MEQVTFQVHRALVLPQVHHLLILPETVERHLTPEVDTLIRGLVMAEKERQASTAT